MSMKDMEKIELFSRRINLRGAAGMNMCGICVDEYVEVAPSHLSNCLARTLPLVNFALFSSSLSPWQNIIFHLFFLIHIDICANIVLNKTSCIPLLELVPKYLFVFLWRGLFRFSSMYQFPSPAVQLLIPGWPPSPRCHKGQGQQSPHPGFTAEKSEPFLIYILQLMGTWFKAGQIKPRLRQML